VTRTLQDAVDVSMLHKLSFLIPLPALTS
jgi:hypothetical protein